MSIRDRIAKAVDRANEEWHRQPAGSDIEWEEFIADSVMEELEDELPEDPRYCSVMVYPAKWYVDPEPAELCGQELYDDFGWRCPQHGFREENNG